MLGHGSMSEPTRDGLLSVGPQERRVTIVSIHAANDFQVRFLLSLWPSSLQWVIECEIILARVRRPNSRSKTRARGTASLRTIGARTSWGGNHERVSKFNAALGRSYNTWFDEERMRGTSTKLDERR